MGQYKYNLKFVLNGGRGRGKGSRPLMDNVQKKDAFLFGCVPLIISIDINMGRRTHKEII